MEGQQLPKATMNSFVKQQIQLHYSPEFLAKLLSLSKQFVVRLSDKANEMCEHYNKKTISAEHLQAALVDLGLNQHISKLKELGSNIKEMNQLKREASQRLEETIERELREQREKRLQQEPQKKAVVIREKFDHIEAVNLQKGDFDYENLIQDDEEENQKQQ